MKQVLNGLKRSLNRRSFMKNGACAAATMGAGLLANTQSVFGKSDSISRGDAALLRFAAAAEILESDFWLQYDELGGIQDDVVPGGSGNPAYTNALQMLDSDF